MKNLAILSIALMVFVATTQAQTFTQGVNSGDQRRVNFTLNKEAEAAEGSPYKYEEWPGGKIVFIDGTSREFEEINFDLSQGNLLFQQNDQKFIVNNQEYIDRVLIDSIKYLRVLLPNQSYSYMEILAGEKILLLELENSKLVKGRPSQGYVQATKDRFVRSTSYFLSPNEGDLIKINPKRGTRIYKHLPTLKNQIKEFEELNGASLTDLNTMISLINFLN
ncbi:MAG: hypothetical protein AAF616_08275 [Bacteroidota bacterium]